MSEKENNPLASIIVPTKNSAETLLACLTSIKNQTYPNIEYIVVDNYSSDTTQDIAKNNEAHLIIAGNERSSQRNAGAKYAKGEFLVFIDSDMELLPGVIHECVKIMQEHSNIQAIVIPEDSFGTTLWARCKNFERSTYANSPWLHGARFFRSSAFFEISGFQEDITGAEDFDIQTRTVNAFGLSGIGYSSIAIRHNEGALTLTHLLKKKYYYGSTLKAYVNQQRNKHMLHKQANPITRIQLFFQNPTFLFRHPIIFTATCIMKTLEFCALGLGYLMKSAV